MTLAFIWAQDQAGLIGKDGTLPWRLPNDLKFFKATTLNHTIVMGRTTFEGMGKRLLPQRHTVVLTHEPTYDAAGAEVCSQVSTLVDRAKTEDIYVIGGAQVFQAFAPYVEVLYQTLIAERFEGDTYMCPLDFEQFDLVERQEGQVDEANRYPHTFLTYKRKRKGH